MAPESSDPGVASEQFAERSVDRRGDQQTRTRRALECFPANLKALASE